MALIDALIFLNNGNKILKLIL